MSDLFEEPEADDPGDNAPEFSVSELSGAVKRTIEGGFSRVRVRGEVGRVSRPRSGHIYLDLKDDRAVLAGVIWKGQAAKLDTLPEEGLEMIATGRLTTFPGQSKYQMIIESIAPAGVGALMAMLEKRKAALQAEGLFDPDRKQPLPYLPEVIGVVTSPSGAVIRDILHRLRERFPRKVLIWPVAVQGAKCAPEVARAIEGFNAMTPGGALPRPDLLIVARGGGSIEDLWGFNEEIVARAAAASAIPLISAVGHETDTTLIDFVSDKRAPTPTAAAELAVPVRADLLAWSTGQGARLTGALARGLDHRGQRLRDLSRALPRPADILRSAEQRLDLWGDRLPRALENGVAARRARLEALSGGVRPAVLAGLARQERAGLARLSERLDQAAALRLERGQRDLASVAARLSVRPLQRRVSEARARDLPALARRLDRAQALQSQARGERLGTAARLLETLDYPQTLARGFAVVRAGDQVVTSAHTSPAGTALEIEFSDGRLAVIAAGGGSPETAPPANKPPRKKPRPPSGQTSLFGD